MNRMTGLKWLFGLAVAAGLILLAMPGYVSAQSASVSASGSLDPGGNGSASIYISAQEIGSFELDISCSSGGVLRFDDITAGSGPGDFIIVDNLTGPDSASVSGFMSTTPISGSLIVANILFTDVGSAGSSTTINVSGTLYAPNGDTITGTSLSGALVQITGQNNGSIAPVLISIVGGLVLIIGFLFWARRRVDLFPFFR